MVADVDAARHDVLIFVPGIMGSKLLHPGGRSAWGKGLDVVWPRDGGVELALPLANGEGEGPGDDLVASEVLDSVSLMGYRQDFYVRLSATFEANGYRLGDPKTPDGRSNFYLFAHDFRFDASEAAEDLGALVERIRGARGSEPLDIHLLCQSNGGNVCRYFAKYGSAGLEEAEALGGRFPEGVRVEKMALVGTANGGAIRVLREFNVGRRLLALGKVGRWFTPETILTFRSLFVELPDRPDNFVDGRGQPMEADVHDVENWERFGWGVWNPDARKRLARKRRWREYRDLKLWREHLSGQLARARRLRRLLDSDSEAFAATDILQIQSRAHLTPRRAVLTEEADGWVTRFWGDPLLEGAPDELREAAALEGDGHATVDALGLSPQESAVEREKMIYLGARHVDLVLTPEAHEHVLRFFGSPDGR